MSRADRWLPPGSARREAALLGRDLIRLARNGVAPAGPRMELAATRAGLRQPYPVHQRRNPASDELLAALAAGDDHRRELFVLVVPDHQHAGEVRATDDSLAAQASSRVHQVILDVEHGWAAAADRALAAAAPEDLVVFVRPGDRFEPDWAARVLDAAWTRPDVEVVTWDDDRVDALGRLRDPRVRLGWAPDTLLSANPYGRSLALRVSALRRIGGFGGSHLDLPVGVLPVGMLPAGVLEVGLWDALLRCAPPSRQVVHLPLCLAHLPVHPDPSPPSGEGVVQAELDRRGWPATARWSGADGVRVMWHLPTWPSVSVIVPSPHNRKLLEPLLASLAATDYPGAVDVVVVDNSGGDERVRSDKRAWVAEHLPGRSSQVVFWDEPFNFSGVNNLGAAQSAGEVLVFCNDDCVAPRSGWLRQLVGWATRDGVGVVGTQLLDEEGGIQHGGVVLGLNGLAEHLFAGMRPGEQSLVGSVEWVRNPSAVTGACQVMRRSTLEAAGGFDETFTMIYSDVYLCLAAAAAGRRTVCVPGTGVVHAESATRGEYRVDDDAFAGYWRLARFVAGGDPAFSPRLAVNAHRPRLRQPGDPSSGELLGPHLGRTFEVFRQQGSTDAARSLAQRCRADDDLVAVVTAGHRAVAGRRPPRKVTWFVPDFDSPFYGGIHTALRISDHLLVHHGVDQRFVFLCPPNERYFRTAIGAAFPALADAAVYFSDGGDGSLAELPPTDVAVATIWHSAYAVARMPGVGRRCYLIQDFEPMFHPAGTEFALAEESYRLGLYGLCNSTTLGDLYADRYGGTAMAFTPAVDSTVFHARGRDPVDHDGPVRVFVYARPGHWRNCWELAEPALRAVKARFGDRVHLITAGSWAHPDAVADGIDHLGMLDYRATGDLYRTCDVGMALTVSAHPSYLPLELMACGVPVVAFDLPAGYWVLRDGENSLLARRTVDSLTDRLSRLVADGGLRSRLSAGALAHIASHHSDWDTALAEVYPFLCDPGPPS